MTEILPNKLVFKYEIFNTGYIFSLIWDNNVLIVKKFSQHPPEDEQIQLSPNNDEWSLFWDSLYDMGIWDWYEVYEVKCMDSCVEGDEWEVNIEFGHEQIESQGSNSYPPTFREFIKAVEELTGIIIEFIHED